MIGCDQLDSEANIFSLEQTLEDSVKEYRNLKLDDVFEEERISQVVYYAYSKLLIRYIGLEGRVLIYAMGDELEGVKEDFEENTLRVYDTANGGVIYGGSWVTMIEELEVELAEAIEQRFDEIDEEERQREEARIARLTAKVERIESFFAEEEEPDEGDSYAMATFEYVDESTVDGQLYARYNILDDDNNIIDIDDDVEYIFDVDTEEELDLVATDYFYMPGNLDSGTYTFQIGLLEGALYLAELEWSKLPDPEPEEDGDDEEEEED